MSLRRVFEILNQSNQKYAVLGEYETLPNGQGDNEITILCDNKKSVKDILRLKDGVSEFAKVPHKISLLGREDVNFPDTFTSRILDRSFRYEELVSVPDDYEAVMLTLIGMAAKDFKNTKFSNHEKRILRRFTEARIGGIIRDTADFLY